MNKFDATYKMLIENDQIIITEDYIHNELKSRLMLNGESFSEQELIELSKIGYALYQEGWVDTVKDSILPMVGHTAAHIAGSLDPTPTIDLLHAAYYFKKGNVIIGTLTLLGAIPYAGDTAKLLIPAVGKGRLAGPFASKLIAKLVSMKDTLVKPLSAIMGKLMQIKQVPKILNNYGIATGTSEIAAKELLRKLFTALNPKKIVSIGRSKKGITGRYANLRNTTKMVPKSKKFLKSLELTRPTKGSLAHSAIYGGIGGYKKEGQYVPGKYDMMGDLSGYGISGDWLGK